MSPRETYHIEILEQGETGEADAVQQRVTVRTETVDLARERALRMFARARVPQRFGVQAEAVRVIDGAGVEVFRWTRFDEPGG